MTSKQISDLKEQGHRVVIFDNLKMILTIISLILTIVVGYIITPLIHANTEKINMQNAIDDRPTKEETFKMMKRAIREDNSQDSMKYCPKELGIKLETTLNEVNKKLDKIIDLHLHK